MAHCLQVRKKPGARTVCGDQRMLEVDKTGSHPLAVRGLSAHGNGNESVTSFLIYRAAVHKASWGGEKQSFYDFRCDLR